MSDNKVYKFYYKGDIEESSILHPTEMSEDGWEELDKHDNPKIRGKYPLYAFTITKKYAKDFKKQRNMDKFIMLSSEITEEEANYLFDTYPDLILNRYNFVTREVINGYNSQKDVEIIATRFEHISCTEDHDMVLMEDADFWINSLPVECYTEKVRKALEVLQYPQLRKLFFSTYNGIMDEEYDYPDVAIDELALFIYNFHETLGC